METWHGSPDARVRGAEVVYRRETEEMYQVSEITSDIGSDYNESRDDESDAASDRASSKQLFSEGSNNAGANCLVQD